MFVTALFALLLAQLATPSPRFAGRGSG
jgi:hypothetical protein